MRNTDRAPKVNAHNNSQAPNINHVVVALFSFFKDFRGDVIRCAAKRCPPHNLHVVTREEKGREPEVADFGVHVAIEEDVSHFQVSMDDTLGVHVFDCPRYLDTVESHLRFRQAFTPFNHVHKRSIRAELEDEVCAVFEGKCAVKLNNVLMAHLRVDLQLRLKLHDS